MHSVWFRRTHRVLSLTLPCEILLLLPGVLSRKLDLKHAENAEHFVTEAVDRIFNLLRCNAREMRHLTCRGEWKASVCNSRDGNEDDEDEGLCSTLIGRATSILSVRTRSIIAIKDVKTYLPCQKNVHCRHSLRSRSSSNPNLSCLSTCLSR